MVDCPQHLSHPRSYLFLLPTHGKVIFPILSIKHVQNPEYAELGLFLLITKFTIQPWRIPQSFETFTPRNSSNCWDHESEFKMIFFLHIRAPSNWETKRRLWSNTSKGSQKVQLGKSKIYESSRKLDLKDVRICMVSWFFRFPEKPKLEPNPFGRWCFVAFVVSLFGFSQLL